jgi:preprotein translocase subunit SecB
MPGVVEKTEKKAKQVQLEYADFLKSLQLHVISLKESSCDIDRVPYWQHKERNLSYKMSAECVDIDSDYFDVRAKIEVAMVGGKQRVHLIKIVASFDLHFHADSILKPLVDRFCKSDVRLIVWPYFREYVSDVSSRMYVPPVILPLSTEQED